MIQIAGTAQQDSILADVLLDGEHVGMLQLSLAQWDRLKQHRTSSYSDGILGGYGVLMSGKEFGLEVNSE